MYEIALDQREKEIKGWQQTVKDSGLTKAQRKQFQTLVENKFQVSNEIKSGVIWGLMKESSVDDSCIMNCL